MNRLKYLLISLSLILFLGKKVFSQTDPTIVISASFKIEEGSLSGSYMVLENLTTNEKQTLKGQSKFNVNVKYNCDYILSFSKPGYITKKIQVNTNVPADRIEQGFYPVTFEVILFKQYEGMNIVIFNQPVSKYKFSKLLDDFNYDTDYTKQIQSALKNAEEELKQKKEEEKLKAGQQMKEAEKLKQDSILNAKVLAKEKSDSIAAAKQLAAVQAEEERKAKADSVKVAKQLATAKAEEERIAKQLMDEEARNAKLKADEEARKQAKAKADEEARQKLTAKMEEEERNKLKAKEEADAKTAALKEKQEEEARRKLKEKEAADEKARLAAKAKEEEEAKRKASYSSGSEIKPEPVKYERVEQEIPAAEKQIEIPANMSVETIEEQNRTITKATLTKNNHSTVYSKVVYKWGGVYYFRGSNSISENIFRAETNLK